MLKARVLTLAFWLAIIPQWVFAMAPLAMKLEAGDTIEIKGFRGDVEYSVEPTATDIKVQVERIDAQKSHPKEVTADSDEWQFTMRREGRRILLLVESPQSKLNWSEILSTTPQQPKFSIKIRAPAVMTKVNWHDGKFSTKNFTNSLHSSLVRGDINIQGGAGELRVDTQSGPVKVIGWKGNVDLETYESNLDVSNVEGDVKVENFVGVSRVTGIAGSVSLRSYKGNTRVSQVKGRVDFKNGNSPLHIDNLEGELRGKTMQGPVFASVRGEANIRVESDEGQINLRLPESGAWVNLGTEGGSLNVPNFLKLTRLPSQQIRSGKLRGSLNGSVFVRTTSGDIQLR